MARLRPAYSKLRAQARERTYTRKIDDIMQPPAYKHSVVISQAERDSMMVKRRLCLKVYTPTDVDWSTIATCDGGTTPEHEEAQRTKLRSLWYTTYAPTYPEGTQWTIKNEYW